MKTTLLFAPSFKKIGWALLVPGVVLGLAIAFAGLDWAVMRMRVFTVMGSSFLGRTEYFSWVQADITYTLAGILVIVGGVLVAFAKTPDEDEYVAHLRLAAFQWAVLVNYLILLVLFLGVYGFEFLLLLPYTMFTTLLLFIARFELQLRRNQKRSSYDQ